MRLNSRPPLGQFGSIAAAGNNPLANIGREDGGSGAVVSLSLARAFCSARALSLSLCVRVCFCVVPMHLQLCAVMCCGGYNDRVLKTCENFVLVYMMSVVRRSFFFSVRFVSDKKLKKI